MKAPIKMIENADMECFAGVQVICTKDSSLMIFVMERVRCIGVMGATTKACGRMVCSMERVKFNVDLGVICFKGMPERRGLF